MYYEINELLKPLDHTYASIFKWLLQNDEEYINCVMSLKRQFFEGKLELKRCYVQSIQQTATALAQASALTEAIVKIENKYLKYLMSKQLLHYLYLDVQKGFFLYNTILNKSLFVIKMESIYSKLSEMVLQDDRKVSKLEFLEYIDNATRFKYTGTQRETRIYIPEPMRKPVDVFIEELSLQKEYERKYHQLLHESWPNVIVSLRGFVWDYLESVNKMPKEDEQKYLLWELFPYIENIK